MAALGSHGADLALARNASRVRAELPLFALDLILTGVSYLTALLLRFDGEVPSRYWNPFAGFLLLAVLTHQASNGAWGLYRKMWRHASVAEARSVLLSGATAIVVLLVASKLTVWMPLSVLLTGGLGAMMLTGAVRFQNRLFAFQRSAGATKGLRVAVVGAGESGATIVREMFRNPSAGLVPVAVLDDDRRIHRRSLAGVPVVDTIECLPDVVRRLGVHQVILAIPSASTELVQRVASLAEQAKVAVKVVPTVGELLSGNVSMSDIRDLRIEDLLGREQVAIDLPAVRASFEGKRVLITGAGGSIGSEIACQVAACGPARLIMVDHDETHLFEASSGLDIEPVQVLADIRDAAVMDQVMARHRPHVVFHAAAHKHVPMLESHPCEAVMTNVVGTANVVRAAASAGVGHFVFISTDKAVQPSSVMGASKWLGEQLVIRLGEPSMKCCSVRFGNVLGSRGSVIPTFARQIAAGGPVTVTDPRMQRFFMSVQEAVQLVLQSTVLAEGGEVFMLEMGRSVNILQLAERMVRLSGNNVGSDVDVVITMPRPGEKLEECLSAPAEAVEPTSHDSILRLRPVPLHPRMVDNGLGTLTTLAAERDDIGAAQALFQMAKGSLVTARVTGDLQAASN